MPVRTCRLCGRAADPLTDGDPPLAWSSEVEASGETVWICSDCTREHVRAIEAKLDRAWW